MLSNEAIRLAMYRALVGSAVAAAATTGTSTSAQAQSVDDNDQPLEEVIVTGTRIRRVDSETASPIYTMAAEQIKESGVTTLGQLIQQIPSISGAATNPQVNNGGGEGASYVELRGLGAERTLLLLNGRRIGVLGQVYNAVDVNMIPVNMIERVEVLKEGAGAVYGSDAIAGVVNIITYSRLSDAEVSADYGVTGKNDGKHHSFSLSWGAGDDQSNLLIGLNYNKQESVSAGDREFSKYALYLYNPAVYGITKGGSSRTPNGRIFLPAATFGSTYSACDVSGGNISVTRSAGAAGTSLADYRCFAGADLYNYQPYNLLMTPQERGSLFALGSHEINDYVTAYSEVLYNRTSSGYKIASLPFDSRADDVVISADNLYNPFGVDLGGIDATNTNAVWRLFELGERTNNVVTSSMQVNAGLKGKLFDTSWNWDTTLSYGRLDQNYITSGYIYLPKFIEGLGPSFIATDGTPTCGTPTAPISNCTPLNIFNLESQADVVNTLAAPYAQNYTYQSRGATLNLSGNVVELPAGALKSAVGVEYHDLNNTYFTDYVSRATAPLYLTCLIASEACSASSSGQYDVTEYYAEFFVPLLKDLPGVTALNFTAGARYSDYSTFGNTTNTTFKVEYRPISDLLVRGSYAEVFRAPTLYNLSHGPLHDAPTFNDPCTGLTSAQLAANPNLNLACVGVTPDSDFEEPNSQVDGLKLSTKSLKPETGQVVTYGLVYDPGWLPDFSASIDFWSYKLDNLITELDPNYTADQCVANATFCQYIFRNADGTILEIQEPVINLGTLKTNGVDIGFKYALPETSIGGFRFTLDTSYIASYENTPAPGSAPIEVAGTYDRQFGNYARWRGLMSAAWSLKNFDATLTARYIHHLRLDDADGQPGIQEPLQIPSVTYFNASFGYTFPTNTKVRAGIDNMFDKDPPILYQNNVLNSNTDVETYDLIGRRWYVGVTQKF